MAAEGVTFVTKADVGKTVDPKKLMADNDAVLLSTGATKPRDLPIPGRQLKGIHFAMEFLTANTASLLDSKHADGKFISAKGKRVVVIGGGDTGSDCVGTSNRHGAKSVTQIELMPRPPENENKAMTWPYWPAKLRTSSSHEEGAERDWAITSKSLAGKNGKLEKLVAARVEWIKDETTGQMRMQEIKGSEFDIQADLVLLAMGFVAPVSNVLTAFGIDQDPRGNARANTDDYKSNVDKVFAAGDMRRGQSLVVWAIREGRQCARSVDEFLMGSSELPR
jgi:glutamate synthase (NADPH/NADH) small chain